MEAASTPASVGMHGMADMIRADGMWRETTAEAMKNVEQVRANYIDNQKQWTDVYLSKRRALDAEHARANEEARNRNARYLEEKANHPDAPSRLDPTQVDRKIGLVDWPSALLRDTFVLYRSDIESLLAQQGREGSNSELSANILRTTRALQEELRAHIREIVPSEYLQARKFLESLAMESRPPM
jgi:hypothetical protein